MGRCSVWVFVAVMAGLPCVVGVSIGLVRGAESVFFFRAVGAGRSKGLGDVAANDGCVVPVKWSQWISRNFCDAVDQCGFTAGLPAEGPAMLAADQRKFVAFVRLQRGRGVRCGQLVSWCSVGHPWS